MTHKEFLAEVHKDLKSAGISKRATDSRVITDIVINVIKDGLIKGHNIEFAEFGKLNLVVRTMNDLSDRNNPKRLSRWVVNFNISKVFSKKLNKHFRDAEKKE